jgi:hypothetical protein
MKRLSIASCVAFACAQVACASYNKRIPDTVVARLPYEARIDLLEAENELAIAIDHVDEAQNEMNRTRLSIRRAKDKRRAAKDDVGDAKDQGSKEVAELAVQEAEARVDYLRARQEVNEDNVDIQEFALQCAQARYQLARLTAARKSKVEGSEKYNPKEFEEQSKQCDAELAKRRAGFKRENEHVVKAKSAWDRQRQALAQKTFDARSSPYVE